MAGFSPERARAEALWGHTPRDGYAIPGSRKTAMKGVTARANSPDTDIINKLPGMRALSRDAAMTSPLGVSILRRHKMEVINDGLQLQSRVNQKKLGLTKDQAKEWQSNVESEYDMLCDSFESDYLGNHNHWEQQILAFFTMLLNGDVFFMLPWVKKRSGFPYELSCHLIDSDLVRNPTDKSYTGKDIKGGVEKDAEGRVVAYHVWDVYSDEVFTANGKLGKSTRVPIYDSSGKRQIWHLYDPERINQRRGVPLLAPVAEQLRQITRLGDAKIMDALVSAYFTVFVKDASGMNGLLNGGLPPIATVNSGGIMDPNSPPVEEHTEDNGNDLEMGYGNVTYLDDQKDIEIADPKKTDSSFEEFWKALATTICSAANMPLEKTMMLYSTSFTAAKAAANDAWRATKFYRKLIERRFCGIFYREFLTEGILRNRIKAPGYFDDVATAYAWSGFSLVGMGQGYLNPLQEAKASTIKQNSFQTTFEEEYAQHTGGRWDRAMEKRAAEEELLKDLGLEHQPAPEEIVGPDGQQNADQQEENTGEENARENNS